LSFCNVTYELINGDDDVNVQERDAALSRQRELMSEVSDLKSQLDSLDSTCHELRLKTRGSPDREKKKNTMIIEGSDDDEESRVLREKIAAMLSDEYVTVPPRQHSILKHLRVLIDRVRDHNAVCTIDHSINQSILVFYRKVTLKVEVTSSRTLSTFKSKLKTYLFSLSFLDF